MSSALTGREWMMASDILNEGNHYRGRSRNRSRNSSFSIEQVGEVFSPQDEAHVSPRSIGSEASVR